MTLISLKEHTFEPELKEISLVETNSPTSLEPLTHSEVLQNLVEQITPIKIREFLNLPEDEELLQKHWIVAIVKNLIEFAREKKWNLSKVYDFTYVYNGQYWLQLDKEDMKLFLGKVAIQSGCPDYEVLYYEFKDKLLKQFLTDGYLPPPPVQQDKVLINLKNGTMKFTSEGWRLHDFNPLDFLTYQLPFDFQPDATCPEFDRFLLEVLPETTSRLILQEFSGYIFTHLNLEKMLILTGSGSNGKSVFFNVLCALIGRQNLLNYSLGSFNHEYNRAKLSNVLLNYSSEKGTEINPDIFKALISGEPLQARLPYGKPFTIHNTVRFIINANELPKETEQNEAYFRRFIIIPFEVTIPENRRDINLAERIITSELSGVFNWLLKGLERLLHEQKFTTSENSLKAIADFKLQSDSVSLFTSEYNIQSDDTNKEPIAEIYTKYKIFCSDNDFKAIGKYKLSARLEKLGFSRTRMNNGAFAFHIVFGTPEV